MNMSHDTYVITHTKVCDRRQIYAAYMNESTFEFVSSNLVLICDQLLDPFSDARLRRQKSVTLRSRTIDTHRRTMTDKLFFSRMVPKFYCIFMCNLTFRQLHFFDWGQWPISTSIIDSKLIDSWIFCRVHINNRLDYFRKYLSDRISVSPTKVFKIPYIV